MVISFDHFRVLKLERQSLFPGRCIAIRCYHIYRSCMVQAGWGEVLRNPSKISIQEEDRAGFQKFAPHQVFTNFFLETDLTLYRVTKQASKRRLFKLHPLFFFSRWTGSVILKAVDLFCANQLRYFGRVPVVVLHFQLACQLLARQRKQAAKRM